MSWLVVGGNGQLGKALSVVLGERGVDFRSWGSEDLDITSALKCNESIGGLAPSVIINAAAWTDVDGAEANSEGAHAVNALGPLNLAIAAKSVGAVFAHVSTDYVFSGKSDRPWREEDLRSPVSVYGMTKAAGEVAVLTEYSERTFIFRTAWLYSQWGKNFARTITRLALFGGGEVRVVNDQVGQPTSAIDLANQIVDSILAELPFGTYHATNSGQGSWFDFAREIFELCGPEASIERVIPVSSKEFPRPAKRPTFSVLAHNRWGSVVGANGQVVTPMRDWKEGLQILMKEIIQSVAEDNSNA
jgi:dTDP-4-dehydrorhamnose reductase